MDWSWGLNSFSYCLEMFFAVFLYLVYLERREHFWVRIGVSLVSLYMCALMNDMFIQYNEYWFFLILGMGVLISFFCCKITWTDAVYCTACGCFTQHFASSLYILIRYRGEQPSWSGIIFLVVYTVSYISFFILFAKNLSDQGHYHAREEVALTLFALAGLVAIVISMVSKRATDMVKADATTGAYAVIFRICQIYAMLVCFSVLLIQVFQRREMRMIKRMEQNETIWKQRQLQYEMSRENIDLINRKCHDLRHQIAALSQMQGEEQRKEKFVKEIQNMVEVYDNDINTGNEALDTILLEKGLYCKMHDIQWTCVADGKLMEFMERLDLYTLMGNALDNAIESVEQLQDKNRKIISARIWKKNNFAVLQVENCYEGIISFEDNFPKTRKKDRENHGIGIRSMKIIAEKYHGTLSVKAEDGVFLLNIVIPL